LYVTNSTFVDNLAVPHRGASEGGAIYNSATVEVTNSTFSANTATTGAGISNHGTVVLINSTLAENEADWAGGIDGGGTLKNTIVANNSGYVNCSAGIQDGGGNLRWPESDPSCVGVFGDPKLGPLQDNGGPTHTMALAPDSAAINAAVDANCPATDQRGISRPQGKQCDIGSFELEPPTKPALVKPPDGKEFSKHEVKLKWNPAERIDHYQVIVRQDSAKGKKVVKDEVTTTKYTTPTLESGHWYYWRIKACSNVKCVGSVVRRFRVN
jgi:hypothetical protein